MKKLVFLTGTRADFGKIKSLIKITQNHNDFEVHIFVTGMHLNDLYGYTVDEIEKSGFKNIFKFSNQDDSLLMDRTLSNTINGFSSFISKIKPDLIVVHGDRVEALAGAIVGSLNNILVAHIEGGEISGTIDELIRHSVSKMAHIHLVSNLEAKNRLIQLGEYRDSIFVLGSPDLDLMLSKSLPKLDLAKNYYEIFFNKFSIAMFHPITTEVDKISNYAKNFTDAIVESKDNFVVIFPNNDHGSKEIISQLLKLKSNKKFRIFPSIRFEYFLTLLKNSQYIIGNSSAGIREAPYYNIPTVDIGTRQKNRAKLNSIFNCGYEKHNILEAINKAKSAISKMNLKNEGNSHFGKGDSDKLFLSLLKSNKFWDISFQKYFQEIK
tara:strand:- start:19503 stop:20642 length:1140 start_codon:yes stop_codon:yes gene_type:complete